MSSELYPSNQNKINDNSEKNKTCNESTNPIILEANLRTKRIYSDNIKNENNSKKDNDINKNERFEISSIQNENEESTKTITNASINNYEISQDNENYKELLRNKFCELKELMTKENRNYLIPRKWFGKFKELFNSSISIKELKGKLDNNELLIDKNIFENALFLNDEKNNIKIIKPKYAFCNALKPLFVNKELWDFFLQNFGGGPEIKIVEEKIENEQKINNYRRDLMKYIKINCIILPPKNNIINSNDYLNEAKKEIQTFYFYFNKNKNVNELLLHLKEIIKTHKNIKIIDLNNYKCLIYLNYDDYNILYKNIIDHISVIYNINNSNNLDKEENDRIDNDNNKYELKIFPLLILYNEITMNIFPNQFTNNFNKLNYSELEEKNEKISYYNSDSLEKKIDKIYEINKYPELNIIIEQIVGSIFPKNPKIKYKISRCEYVHCNYKGILPYFCECEKLFYCSEKCKNCNEKYHEENCSNLLLKYFQNINEKINYKITDESALGVKGIKNIGNTCYINTSIQCLSNCLELRNYFLFGNPHKDINTNNILGYKGLVAYGFEYIIKRLWLDKEKVLDISKFKNAMGVCNDRFSGMNQQDTHEFVTFLIDSLHEDLNRVNNKAYIPKEERDMDDNIKSKIEWNNFLRRNQSILVDLFYGVFKSTVTCKECKKSCVDFNTFSSLSLNLKNYNKKNNQNDLSIRLNKLNLNSNSRENSAYKINNKENKYEENKNSENKENYIQDINFKIRTETISLSKKEPIDIINSEKKEEILVGGKENENEIESVRDKEKSSELPISIRIIFFLYSSEEKPIQFILPILDKKELSYKVLLLKISKIFNKNPYSLYLYHTDEDKNIANVYNINGFNLYEKEKNLLLLCIEIDKDIMKRNLTFNSNSIFYDSFILQYNKIKFTTRQILEKFLSENKNNIIKYIKNVINEKTDCSSLKDEYLNNHYMNIEKVYQLTLKNYIYENEKEIVFNYPKIVVFPKVINILNLYYEIFNIKKYIILENDQDNNDKKIYDKNKIINEYFKGLTVTDENLDNIFEKNDLPFYLSLQKYNNITIMNDKEIKLLLNEKEKNKKLIDILSDTNEQYEQKNFPNEQIILKVYWNPKYNPKLKNYLRPEKIDSFLNQLIDLNEKKDIKINDNILNNSSNKKNTKMTDEECQKAIKDRWYFNYYANFKRKNSDSPKYITTNSIYNSNKKDFKNNKIENYIQLNQEISLDDTFEILREEELLDENNEWFCENCKKKQKAIKKLEIYNAPKILIIQIKRFSHNNKINTKVNFPLKNLDISNYIISKYKKKIKYDLFAVANHYGSLYYGHYTAFCKNSINNRWYEYNDSCVTEINDESKIISSNAYVLFYRQKNLSKLNWNKIYNKKYIEIDINNPNTLIDFDYDFIKNIKNEKNELNNENKDDNEKDINEFDKIIRDRYISKRKEKNNNQSIKNKDKKENMNSENSTNNNENNKNNRKDSNNFLAKKRSSSDKN